MFGTNEIVGKRFFKDVDQNKLFVTSMFMTLQGEGPFRGEPAFFIRLAKCNLACNFCFPPNTKISMGDGSHKKIKDITVGDTVTSWDEANNIFVTGTVSETMKNDTDKLIKINVLTGAPTWATPEHPFLVKNKGWVKAKDLLVDNVLLHYSTSDREVVQSIEYVTKGSGAAWTRFAGSKFADAPVYNFEVDKYHTYIANGKIVHNCDTFFDDGEWLTFDEIEQRIDETIDKFYVDQNMDRPAWTKIHESYPLISPPAEPDQYDFLGEMTSYRDHIITPRKMVLVMTGGEPMLQDNIGPFLTKMEPSFANTQIESNGTQAASIPDSTTLVCSPKCMEKNGVATKYLTPRKDILARADCLKFVMEADSTSPYSTIPEWAHEWRRETGREIFISPMNVYNDVPLESKKLRLNSNSTSIEERSQIDEVVSFWEPGLLNMPANQINHEYTAAFCMKHGYTLNLQIHLYASLA